MRKLEQNKFALVATIICALMTFASCSEVDKPLPSQRAHAQALSGRIVTVKSYEIPKGIFRGVLWPESKEKNFIIWIIRDQKEIYFQVSAPSNFSDFSEDVTSAWDVQEITIQDNYVKYSVVKKNKTKSMNLDLPLNKRKYLFSVLKNITGEEMVVFMDISETISDRGFFGFVIVE